MQTVIVQVGVSANAACPASPCAGLPRSSRSSSRVLCSKSSPLMGDAIPSDCHNNSQAQRSQNKNRGTTLQVHAGLFDHTPLSFLPDPLGLFDSRDKKHIEAEAMISKRTVVDFDNPVTSFVDANVDFLGLGKVGFRLVSKDLGKNGKPRISDPATFENYALTDLNPLAGAEKYKITFKVDKDFGEIGAVLVKNDHMNEFFLHTLTLKLGDGQTADFFCNSWVNPERYEYEWKWGLQYNPIPDRVFFVNKPYLPQDTPAGLKEYREQDLQLLRGNGKGTRVFYERIYDYDVYNDLGWPDANPPILRPVLGGKNLPYPRRCRTGRGYSSTKNPAVPSDIPSEKALSPDLMEAVQGNLVGLIDLYIPADEFFGGEKSSGFLAVGLKSVSHTVVGALRDQLTDKTPYFDSLDDFKRLYASGIKMEDDDGKRSALPFVKSIFDPEGQDQSVLKFPLPQVFADFLNPFHGLYTAQAKYLAELLMSLAENDIAWSYDEEFGRQTLAGLNPVVIEAVKEYPPKSVLNLPEDMYGPHTALTEEHILPYLEGLSVQEAIDANKLFTIDYHDPFAVYLRNIFEGKLSKGKVGYAPRAIFFYNSKGAMMPVAIELSKPEGSTFKHRVFTPPLQKTDKNPLWELAKVHFSSLDFGFHELVSHWTKTHAVMEPFVIATRRQLSTMHPIYSLLSPCYKNTMMINAAARASLINAEGIIESNFLPGEFSLEMSAVMYGLTWTFEKQGLPNDLISRGMAVHDESKPAGVSLVIDDYPYAEDALLIWEALHSWVTDYVNIVYKSDDAVRNDKELQAWWDEIVHVGHADILKGWPSCDSKASLVDICSTIHWIGGPLHAAVNFGQYAYGGFTPNKPSVCTRWIPEEGTPEYKELERDPMKFLLSSIAHQFTAYQIMTTVELLVQHGTDEEYVGTRKDLWTSDTQILEAFNKHAEKIKGIQRTLEERNKNSSKLNRSGLVKLPYTLLYPESTSGLTGRGVPNSISI